MYELKEYINAANYSKEKLMDTEDEMPEIDKEVKAVEKESLFYFLRYLLTDF